MDESYTLSMPKTPKKTPKKKQKYPYLQRRKVESTDTPSKLKPINLLFEQFQPRAQQNVRTGGLLGIEKKYLDCNRTLLTLTAPTDIAGSEISPTAGTGGCVGCLSSPGTGSAFNQRDGAKIQLKSILVKGMILVPPQLDQSGMDTACIVTVALVMDTQTNGATLDSESVYTNPGGQAAQNCNVLRNVSFTERFKVLKMTQFTLPQVSASYDGTNIEVSGTSIPFTLSSKLNATVKFTSGSTTADVANVIDNSLHIIAWVNNTAYGAQIGYNSRLRFMG